jgi:hypothetical protein
MDTAFILVGCWHAPSLPPTIVSPSRNCNYFRDFASVGLLDSNEAWLPLFRSSMLPLTSTFVEDRFTVILLSVPPPLSTLICRISLFDVHSVAASHPKSDIDPAPPPALLSEPVVAPTEPVAAPIERPGRHRLVPVVSPAAHAHPPAFDPPPPLTVDPATPVSILYDQDKNVTWSMRPFASFGTNVLDTCILTLSVTRTRTLLGYPACLSPPRSISVRSASRPSFTKPTSLPLLPARLLNANDVFLSTLHLWCNHPKRFVASVACLAKRVTYSFITAPRFTVLLFVTSVACMAKCATYSCLTTFQQLAFWRYSSIQGSSHRVASAAGSTQPARGRGILCLCLLLSLRLRTRTLSPRYSKRFDTFVETNWSIISGEVTPNERALGSVTRRKLK